MAKMGRPSKWTSPEWLAEQAENYFVECDKQGKAYGVEGFCAFVGSYRQMLHDYENKPDFSDAIKRIKGRIVADHESRLLSGKGSPVGPIFALKQMGWKDQKSEHVEGNITVEIVTQ